MDPQFATVLYVLVGIIGLVVLIAQLRLFSIDKTLKDISAKLGATPATPSKKIGKWNQEKMAFEFEPEDKTSAKA